jgi:hypothetical protein
MAEISLSVTKGVLAYATAERAKERQIAYSEASSEVAAALAKVDRANPVRLRIAGALTLTVSDRGAIWLAHNQDATDDFQALFDFLARYPSQRLRFVCELAT